MVRPTRRTQPPKHVIDVLEITSSEPEDDDIGPLPPPLPPSNPTRTRSSAKPSTSKQPLANPPSASGRQRLGRKAAPFPLVSPPPTDNEQTKDGVSNLKPLKKVPAIVTKKRASPLKVIEISDSSSDDELVRPQSAAAAKSSNGKGKGKARAIDVDVDGENKGEDDEEEEEPLFLPDSQPTPSKRRAPAPRFLFSSSPAPAPAPLPKIDDFHDDYAGYEDLWADDEDVPGPVAGPANRNHHDVDDPFVDVPVLPIRHPIQPVLPNRRPLKRRRLDSDDGKEEPEPSQGPTPPAQNPTPPPPPAPPIPQANFARAGPSNASSDYEFEELDPEQLEAIVVAAEAEDGHRAGPSRQPQQVHTVVDVDALPSAAPRHAEERDANAHAIDVDADVVHPPLSEPEIQVEEEDPRTKPVARILEIIPDVEPDHLLALVETHLPTYGPEQIVEYLVAHLFENPGYPRVVKGKGKGKERAEGGTTTRAKRKSDEGAGGRTKKPKIDYTSTERTTPNITAEYTILALEALQIAFPLVPLPYIRRELNVRKGFYAPAYLYLDEEEKRVEREGEWTRRYQIKMTPYKSGRGKGKGREVQDEGFEEERRWLEGYIERGPGAPDTDGKDDEDGDGDGVQDDDDDDKEDDDEDLEDDGTFIECGCCFSSFPFDRLTQCPDAHLFCRTCLRAYASTQLGSQNTSITCMHTSGCTLQFPDSELERLLPPKLWGLYNRLSQQKQLKEANIPNLEECPFCEWACVLETPPEEDKLFRCGNEERCGEVSCRLCKRKEHTPRTCKEVEEDRFLDKRLRIEEAMTEALMRKCPKCSKSFIKEHGCNKMTCPHCRTLSCYICRKIITGYDHFHQNNPGQPGGSSTNKKCPLWDVSLDQRHDQEVKDAYKRAVEEVQKENPDVEIGKDIKVDLPKSPPKPAPGALPPGYIDPARMGFGGVGAFAGRLGAFHAPPMPPVPPHLDLLPLQNRQNILLAQLQRARRTVAEAEVRLRNGNRTENELREVLRMSGTAVGRKSSRRSNLDQVTRQNLSQAAVDVAAQQVRVQNARQEIDHLTRDVEQVRQEMAQRQRDQEVWRNQQRNRLQAVEDELDRLQAERDREADLRRRAREILEAEEAMRLMRHRRAAEAAEQERRAMRAEVMAAARRERRNRAAVPPPPPAVRHAEWEPLMQEAARRQQERVQRDVQAAAGTPEARAPQPAAPARRTRQRNRK